MYRFMLSLFAGGLLLGAFAGRAEADVGFCNKSSDQLSLAFYGGRLDKPISTGWFTMDAGQCLRVWQGDYPETRIYFYAERYYRGRWIPMFEDTEGQGTLPVCVDVSGNEFEYKGDQISRCVRGAELRGFIRASVPSRNEGSYYIDLRIDPVFQ